MTKTIAIILIALTLWMSHRTEITIGRVINNEGDGKEYNGEEYYNYIAYPEKYKENDIILTYFLKNPLNNYEDDYLIRHDVRLLKNV